ncbi:phosphoadenosine phosphosulfate reductase domain-containing protein, partial [Escherichia coli]
MPGTIIKIRTGEDVLSAAIHRIEWLFDIFSSVCLSFSGGKDSTVLFHLVAGVARRKKRRFSVLFIDWEAQYQCTIEHIQK